MHVDPREAGGQLLPGRELDGAVGQAGELSSGMDLDYTIAGVLAAAVDT
jgi:hypothetical protein